jgi:hypothetical protein
MTTAAPETGKITPEPAAATTEVKDPVAATIVTDPETKPAAAADPKKEPEVSKPLEIKPLELKLPEGSHLTAETVAQVAARAKELNLTPEQAQAELNRESDLVKTFVDGEKARLAKEVNTWVDESKKDPEIGGEKFAASAETAKRVVNRFGTEAFKKALNDSGLGNHPELVRVFTRIGRAMTEDQLVLSTGNAVVPRSAAEVLYGDSSKTEK